MEGEDSGSAWLLGSADAVQDWDEEVTSWLASEGSWGLGFFEAPVSSKG